MRLLHPHLCSEVIDSILPVRINTKLISPWRPMFNVSRPVACVWRKASGDVGRQAARGQYKTGRAKGAKGAKSHFHECIRCAEAGRRARFRAVVD